MGLNTFVLLMASCLSSIYSQGRPPYPPPPAAYPTQPPPPAAYPQPPPPPPAYPQPPPPPAAYPTPATVQKYNPDIGQTNVGGYGVNKDPYCHKVEKVIFVNQCEPYTEKTC